MRGFVRGFTLVELLVALLLFSLLLLALYRFFLGHLYTLRSQSVRLDTLEYARAVMDLMSRDIRQAGYNPLASPACGRVVVAEADCLAFEADTDEPPDGNCSGGDESITYHLEGGTIKRRLGSPSCSGGESLLDLPSGSRVSLEFSYFAAAGGPLGRSPVDLGGIKRVRLRVSIGVPHPDPRLGGLMDMVLTSSVTLRNGEVP